MEIDDLEEKRKEQKEEQERERRAGRAVWRAKRHQEDGVRLLEYLKQLAEKRPGYVPDPVRMAVMYAVQHGTSGYGSWHERDWRKTHFRLHLMVYTSSKKDVRERLVQGGFKRAMKRYSYTPKEDNYYEWIGEEMPGDTEPQKLPEGVVSLRKLTTGRENQTYLPEVNGSWVTFEIKAKVSGRSVGLMGRLTPDAADHLAHELRCAASEARQNQRKFEHQRTKPSGGLKMIPGGAEGDGDAEDD